MSADSGINDRTGASQVRLVESAGEQIGVVEMEMALQFAPAAELD